MNDNLLEEVYAHVRQVYPHECCGVLTGNNDTREIAGVYPVKNLNQERAHDRYEMDPQEYQRIEEQAKIDGLSVLGFYHSHPDHPCAPSEFDTQAAWGAYQFSREISLQTYPTAYMRFTPSNSE